MVRVLSKSTEKEKATDCKVVLSVEASSFSSSSSFLQKHFVSLNLKLFARLPVTNTTCCTIQLIKQAQHKFSVCKLSASYDSLINPLSLRLRLRRLLILPLSWLRIRDPYFCLLSG